MVKGNRNAVNKDVLKHPVPQGVRDPHLAGEGHSPGVNVPEGLNIEVVPVDWQALDNSNLNVINRVGIQRNKQVGCSGSTNTGHSSGPSDCEHPSKTGAPKVSDK